MHQPHYGADVATAAPEPIVDALTSAMTAAEVPLNDRIWVAMRVAGLTHYDLAKRLGVSQSGVSRRLSGEYAWRDTELAELARLLNVSLSQLLGAEPSIKRENRVSAAPSTGVRRGQTSAGPVPLPEQPQPDLNGGRKRRKTAAP
jgi:transcriptional regulator with XRE-family HTH domain